SLVRPPQKDFSISSRYGTITLELPANSAFNIDAHTEFGQVDSEFEGLSIDRSRRERSARGRIGQGGPQITISARNGDIHLSRRRSCFALIRKLQPPKSLARAATRPQNTQRRRRHGGSSPFRSTSRSTTPSGH